MSSPFSVGREIEQRLPDAVNWRVDNSRCRHGEDMVGAQRWQVGVGHREEFKGRANAGWLCLFTPPSRQSHVPRGKCEETEFAKEPGEYEHLQPSTITTAQATVVHSFPPLSLFSHWRSSTSGLLRLCLEMLRSASTRLSSEGLGARRRVRQPAPTRIPPRRGTEQQRCRCSRTATCFPREGCAYTGICTLGMPYVTSPRQLRVAAARRW